MAIMARAAILDLLDLVLGELVGIVLEAERVEANVASAVDRAVGELEEEGDLKQANEPEHLPEGTRLDGRVVEAPHLLALVPLVIEGEVVEVLDDGASGGEHANPSVLDLSLTSPHNVAHGAEDATVDGPGRRVHVPVAAKVGRRVEALHADLGGRGGTCATRSVREHWHHNDPRRGVQPSELTFQIVPNDETP